MSIALTLKISITGLVQGVCYRQSTLERAQKIGISGWVMNCEDGSVECVAQAGLLQLVDFMAWLSLGPKSARVDWVESDIIAHEALQSFVIR